MYRELYKQVEEGREVVGKILLTDGKIEYEDIPESLQKEFEIWGVNIAGKKHTSVDNPLTFFKALPLLFIQGRVRVSEIKKREK